MTEIEPYRAGGEVAQRDTDSWTQMLPAVGDLAQRISGTEFVPAPLRGKPAAVAASVLAGREIGLPPMASLQHIHIIDGRPSLSAQMQRALILSAGHELRVTEASLTRCVMAGRRRGQEEWTTVTWSMDDAKRAGLSGKKNWTNHPRRMLQARATSELAQLLFADVIAGMASTEEITDDAEGPGAEPEGKPARRTAQRRSKPSGGMEDVAELSTVTAGGSVRVATREESAKAPRAEVPPPPLPGEDGYESGEEVTKPQLTKIATVFGVIGWTDRADKLHAASAIVGRPLLSAKELTKAEAHTLIDTLDMVANGPDPADRLTELVASVTRAESNVVDAEIVEDPR